MEASIPNFNSQYVIYEYFRSFSILERIAEFKNLDVKLRLAYAIEEIKLNNKFVDEKSGDLKECHKLYYKLTDLWFAYETFCKFHNSTQQTQFVSNFIWVEAPSQMFYFNHNEILQDALSLAVSSFQHIYQYPKDLNSFIQYLDYCLANSRHQGRRNQPSQVLRLEDIIRRVRNSDLNFTHKDLLTITYSVRNNFVHNGETTVVPASNLDYYEKALLLRILYSYLAVSLLNWVNIACNNKVNSKIQFDIKKRDSSIS